MTIKVTYNVTDVYVTQDVSPVYINVSYSGGGSGGAAVWGGITGTLSDQTDLQNALDAKVPYTGATTNVNLGEYEIKAGQLTLDTSPTGTAAVGTTRWNDTIGSSETTLKGGSVILKNGVDLVARVVNKVSPNTTLTKAAYQAVRVSGAQGQRLAVAFAQANNDANSADTIGLVTETIATNQEGFIITVGQIENINTTGSLQGETWADGDVLYLSPTIAGAITKVKPTGNGHIVVIGYVEYAHANNGKIYVKVMNGWELDELHDVAIVTPLNNEALIYESATALWKNKSIATALGYTPANAATTLTINGVTFDLSTSRTFTVGSVTGSGASGQVAYWDGTTSQAGSADLQWNGTNLLLGNDKGVVLQTAGTNRNILLKAAVVANNFSGVNLYPQGGTNVGTALVISPKGTGFSAQLKSQVSLFNTDFFADSVNYEFAVLRAAGDRFSFSTGQQGTGVNRPFLLSSGFADGITNPNHLWLYTNGNVGINTSSDSGQRLQVQGTTLLNGNVTFSSATGMTWDAANSRLGIGTNTPTDTVVVRKDVNTFNTLLVQNSSTGLSAAAAITIASDTTGTFVGTYSSTRANSNVDQYSTGSSTIIEYNGNASLNLSSIFPTGTNRGIRFWTSVSSVTATEKMRLFASGNLLLQNGGTFTDSGERLQVTGNVKIVGSGNTSATNALTVQNSGTNNIFRVRNDGYVFFGTQDTFLFPTADGSNISTSGRGLFIVTNASGQGTGAVRISGSSLITTGNDWSLWLSHSFAPTSGTASHSGLLLNQTINQTGGANGITRGLYVNPTLTAAADFRAIETTNGKVIFGNLPTSSAGLPTGAIWNDAGTIKIV
jgi:nitrogen fixation protein